MRAKAHAIARGPKTKNPDGTTEIPLHVEMPDGTMGVAQVAFFDKDVAFLEAYFKSKDGMDPIEVEI